MPTFLSNSIELMKELAVAGDGIAFLNPFDVLEEIRKGSLVRLNLADRTLAGNTLMLVCRRKRVLDTTALLFADALIDQLDSE